MKDMPEPVATLGIDIEESDIWEALCSLDPSKAQGIDEIGPKILRLCATAISAPLHHLFQLTLNHIFSRLWKIHSLSQCISWVKDYLPTATELSLLFAPLPRFLSILCTAKALNKALDLFPTKFRPVNLDFLPKDLVYSSYALMDCVH